MTVTDAIGRQTTTVLPFYSSSTLLAPGLQSYSAEIGGVRRNYGLVSNDYNNIAASATYRRGLSSYLTIETHAEGTSDLFMEGGGAVVNVDNLAVINFAAAGSTGAGRSGTQLSFGVQRIGRIFSLSASETIASRNFLDIAAVNGDPIARRQLNASASLSVGWGGSFSVAYTGLDSDAAAEPFSFFEPAGSLLAETSNSPQGQFISFIPAEHTHLLTASYSWPIYRAAFYATGFHDLTNGDNTGVMVGFTVPLGSRSSASAFLNSGSGGRSHIRA